MAYSQFATINDPDGFVFVRKDSNIKSKIVDTIFNGEYFLCEDSYDNKGNWINISYFKHGKEKDGYMYKDRIKELSSFQKIPGIKRSKSSLEMKMDSISIIIKTEKFVKGKNKLIYDKKDGLMINGRLIEGTDNEVPRLQYKSIEIKINSKSVIVPDSIYNDLYQPTLENTNAYYDKTTDRLFIMADNSDAAGSYSVLWVFEKGVYVTRFVIHTC
jgi:hypothetical protein